MQIGQAKNVAKHWVARHAATIDGFTGAFLAGSILDRDDAEELPVTSDVDVMIVVSGETPPKPGKLRIDGVLLEITYLPATSFQRATAILGDYHLANSFAKTTLLNDPHGVLAPVHHEVAAHFADPAWIRVRCEDARTRAVERLAAFRPEMPFHTQVVLWMFGNGIVVHQLLVAARQNPTVRTRYAAVRALLARAGRLDVYEALLDLIGCRHLRQEQVRIHLTRLAAAFDAVTPFATLDIPFAADLQPDARFVAIGGSLDLVERGLHREAVFWMVATWARILTAFDRHRRDREFAAGEANFRTLIGDLGITSYADLDRARARTLHFLPTVDATAEALIGSAKVRPGGR